jgi:putative transposase
MSKKSNLYRRHGFPAEIISYCVWLYNAFPVSYRDVEKMMLYRGIFVTYESIREWCKKFGQHYANEMRRRRPKPGGKWHLEVVVAIDGQKCYLWRAVDLQGNVLDILMQSRRDTKAAKKFFCKLLKKQGFAPRVIVIDKLKVYAAARKEILKGVEHRQHKGLNNRAENSHQPTRVREKRMRKFKSPGQAQRFLSAFELIRGHFHPKQHLLTASEYRQEMCQRIENWRELAGIESAAWPELLFSSRKWSTFLIKPVLS